MNGRAVLFVLGNLLLILGLALIAPTLVALFTDGQSTGPVGEFAAFAITIAACWVVGGTTRWIFRKYADGVGLREGFAIVTFAWLTSSVFGMIPYLLTGTATSVVDAFFETISGFTTTGASIFPEVEQIPMAVMFWRCMTQWLGGMGIVVLSVALLPMLGVGGYRMLKAETPGGVAFERERPRITDSAKELWRLYLGLSALLTGLFWVQGMTLFDAVCHAFTTLSTGGFSTHTESAGYFGSPTIQWTMILFMFIAGINFSHYSHLITGNLRSSLKDIELRTYAAIIFVCTLVIAAVLSEQGWSEKVVRNAAFQVVTIATTTGFATADFNLWPYSTRMILLLLMFVGGSMGSTSGGVKVARIVIYGKSIVRELYRLIFPHSVTPLRVGDRVMEPSVLSNIFAFGSVYIACFIVGGLVMTSAGYDIVTSMSASAAAIGNIGPGLAAVGPAANWSHLPDYCKWVMSALMLLGRLELMSVLVLLTPWAWQR